MKVKVKDYDQYSNYEFECVSAARDALRLTLYSDSKSETWALTERV